MNAPTLGELAAEAPRLRFPGFDADAAWRLGCLLRNHAVKDALAVVIEISVAGHVLFTSALPGTSPDNAEWIRRKRNTVMRFHRPSLALRLECETKGISLSERYGLSERDFAASGGGVPIAIEGTGVVGAAVVSGLPDVDDHRMVAQAMQAMLAAAPE